MLTSEVEQEQERERARDALLGATVAGRYVVRSLVGHGGMGAVYEAEQIGLGKRVAIKFVDAEFARDEQVVTRFAREGRAMSSIESAHIVTVLDAGTCSGRPFLVMELLRGEDLGKRLRRDRVLPVAEAMHVTAQVLKGLGRAHAAGIIHRDLKPDNVFITRGDSDPLFVKIVDFGISKIDRPRAGTTPLALTGRGTVIGTPFYMSPEQAQARPDMDLRADLYSVGAILFECLTGRPPHTGETYEAVILSICLKDAPDVRAVDPSVPRDVAAFVAKALAREREDRFASAEAMLSALHDAAPAERERVPLDPPTPPGMERDPSDTIRDSDALVAKAPPTQLGVAPVAAVDLAPSEPIRVHPREREADRTVLSGSEMAEPAAMPPDSVHVSAPAGRHDDARVSLARPRGSRPSAAQPAKSSVWMAGGLALLVGALVSTALILWRTRATDAPPQAPRSSVRAPPLRRVPSATAAPTAPSAAAEPSAAAAPPTEAASAVPAPKAAPHRVPAVPRVHKAPPSPSGTKSLDIQRDLP